MFLQFLLLTMVDVIILRTYKYRKLSSMHGFYACWNFEMRPSLFALHKAECTAAS